MVPGGTGVFSLLSFRCPCLEPDPCVSNRDQRHFPRLLQGHKIVSFVNCLEVLRQKPTGSTKTLTFWGNRCGLGMSSEARELLAVIALLWEILNQLLSLSELISTHSSCIIRL